MPSVVHRIVFYGVLHPKEGGGIFEEQAINAFQMNCSGKIWPRDDNSEQYFIKCHYSVGQKT
jgi:hypothetical protein